MLDICGSAVFHHPTVSLSFSRQSREAPSRWAEESPRAGVFHPVTRRTDLAKRGAEEVMWNTLGAPLQEEAL